MHKSTQHENGKLNGNGYSTIKNTIMTKMSFPKQQTCRLIQVALDLALRVWGGRSHPLMSELKKKKPCPHLCFETGSTLESSGTGHLSHPAEYSVLSLAWSLAMEGLNWNLSKYNPCWSSCTKMPQSRALRQPERLVNVGWHKDGEEDRLTDWQTCV